MASRTSLNCHQIKQLASQHIITGKNRVNHGIIKVEIPKFISVADLYGKNVIHKKML